MKPELGSLRTNPFARLDQYELRNLARHLAEAGRAADLHRILSMSSKPRDSAERRNDWFEAKDQNGSLQEYVSDLMTGWLLSNEESIASVERGEPSGSLGLEARYAIMTASTASLASPMPGGFLVALVRHGRWTVTQAIAYARRQPDPGLRAAALAALVADEQEPLRRILIAEILESIQMVSLEWVAGGSETPELPGTRAGVVQMLLPHLEEGQRELALSVARAMPVSSQRCRALAAIGAHSEKSVAAVLFTEALASLDSSSSADAFEALAAYLPSELIPTAIEAANRVSHPYQRTLSIEAFLDRLPDSARTEVLDGVRSRMSGLDEDQQLELRAKMARWLPADELAVMAASAAKVTDDMRRIHILTMLLPSLSGVVREHALARAWKAASAMEMEAGTYKVEAIACVAPFLQPRDRTEALRTAFRALVITQPDAKPGALSMLAPVLPVELLDEAIAAARLFDNEYYATLEMRALGALSEQAPAVLTTADLNKILRALRRMKSIENREYVLWALAPRLAEVYPIFGRRFARLSVQARTAAAEIPPSAARGGRPASRHGSAVQRAIGAVLPRWAVRQRLGRWLATENAKLLAVLARQLAGPAGREALEAAKATDDELLRCRLLTQLLAYLPDAAKPEIADVVLATGPDVAWRFMDEVVPFIGEARIMDCLAAVRKLAESHIRAHALLALLPRLPAGTTDGVIVEILEAAAPEEPHRDTLSWVVQELGPLLSRRQVATLLADVSRRSDPVQRLDLLLALIPHLGSERVRDELRVAFRYAFDLADLSTRRSRVHSLMPHIRSAFTLTELYGIWREALAVMASRPRDQALADVAALSPLLALLGGPTAVVETAAAVRDLREWWP